jgi:peptidoglycan/xylan/chitin deacetylase (PgdA/CDA1 family)
MAFERRKMESMKIVQCWDDGVVDDIRLIEILRRHDAKASFNLNYGLHSATRSAGWNFRGVKEVQRLALPELLEVYAGFTIANHTTTHPHLSQISEADARHELAEGRAALEDHFGVDVTGLAYPFGSYNERVEELVQETGHVYARTCFNATPCFPPQSPMAFHADCHFLSPDFWVKFELALQQSEVFYFWGHSYELVTEPDWMAFEAQIEKLCAQEGAVWADLPELFA